MRIKQGLVSFAAVSGLSALAARATRRQLRILCYHGLWVTPGHQFGNCLFMPPEQFDARMARVKRSGLPVLPLEEAIERLATDTLPDRAVVITIDDGWASTHSHMLPILEAYGLPATLYVTSWYAKRDLPIVNVTVDYLLAAASRSDLERNAEIALIEGLPENERLQALRHLGASIGVDEAWLEHRQFHLMQTPELADAARRGLDLQLHTHRHIDVATEAHRLPEEVAENRAFLMAATGQPQPAHFCYPSGSFHRSAPALLASSGVRSATLVDEGLNAANSDPYLLRRFVDGRSITPTHFDAYLSGTLHYLSALQEFATPRRVFADAAKLSPAAG